MIKKQYLTWYSAKTRINCILKQKKLQKQILNKKPLLKFICSYLIIFYVFIQINNTEDL